MSNKKEILMESIDILIAERLSKLKFLRLLTGVVVAVIDPINYTVLIDDSETSAKATNGIAYLVNDIVEIITENNNLQNKRILWKRP